MLQIDHFVISCETLTEGQAWLEDRLGVTMSPGGQHAHFGTHNMLLGLGDGLYLEVICVDPSAPKPDYARWFDLDRFTGAPRPTTWVARTDDLERALERAPNGAGDPVSLSRGDLRWQMAVPSNGRLPYDGLFPALIEWQGAAHPAERLKQMGVRLVQATLTHPQNAEFSADLKQLINDDRIVIEQGPSAMSLTFETPLGLVTI